MTRDFRGIYAAVVTPYAEDGHPSAEQLARCLFNLAERGCHGVLVAGTTGEGPSLSAAERRDLFEAAVAAKSGLRLLAGTGASSLEDAVFITRAAFDAGMDAAVIIPPFFYGGADDEGLYAFYTALIRQAVPDDGAIFLYHNPPVCGVGLSFELIARLRDSFPRQVVGIKDSSYDWAHTRGLIDGFEGFAVLNGDDKALSQTLEVGGAGSITLVANAFPDLAREVFDLHAAGKPLEEAQERLTLAHRQFDGLPRTAALKTLLKAGGVIDNDAIRPPLRPLNEQEDALLRERFLLDLEIPSTIRLRDLFGDA